MIMIKKTAAMQKTMIREKCHTKIYFKKNPKPYLVFVNIRFNIQRLQHIKLVNFPKRHPIIIISWHQITDLTNQPKKNS